MRNYLSNLSQDQIDNILYRFDLGQSVKSIAKYYNFSPPAISRLLISNDRIPKSSKLNDSLRSILFTFEQKQFTIGTLLGDGCLYFDRNCKNYKLSFGHCEKQKGYFDYKVNFLKPFIKSTRKSIDKRGNSIMYQCSTITHSEFNQFSKLFYNDRVKYIGDIKNYLTPLALAIWIQDDGSLNSNVNMRIASMSFTYDENVKLIGYLKDNFDLIAKVMPYKNNNKPAFYITFDKQNTIKLINIIKPFVVRCMMYKCTIKI